MLYDRDQFLQETCEIVSELFNVEITIIDTEFMRLAGTGEYLREVGQRVVNPNVFKAVIDKNETIIISKPSEDPICAACSHLQSCREKAAVYAPLHVRGEMRGAIGIIAFTDEQKNNGFFNNRAFVHFTEKLCELISGKIEAAEYAYELRVNLNETTAILNSVHDGVIAVNNAGEIYRINQSAARKFGIGTDMIGKKISEIIADQAAERICRGEEYLDYELTVRGSKHEEYNILMTTKKIRDKGEDYGTILIMKSLDEAGNIASKIVHESDYKVDFSHIIGDSKSIRDVISFSSKISDSDSTVLIRGESGTGKELFARAIHNQSSRRDGPFVAINCGAIPEALLESELFGYEDGAFTGARKGGKIGKCQLANGGTLFLDEVGDIPIFLQVKFLRMLQERQIERVGGSKPIPIDIRVIAATNRNLESMIENNEFRSDLYYRLNVIPLFIPPLRERSEDILIISKHFMQKYSQLLRKNIRDMTPQAAKILKEYSWPGNIRELENTIECALNVEGQDILTSFSIPERIRKGGDQASLLQRKQEETVEYEHMEHYSKRSAETLKERRKKADIDEVIRALDKYGWDTKGKKAAAQSLGIGIATLYRILKADQS